MRPQQPEQYQPYTGINSTDEATAILYLVETMFGELSQSVTVVLGLSNFLLAEVEANDQFTTDITTIVKQAQRMRELVEGIHYITRYKASFY